MSKQPELFPTRPDRDPLYSIRTWDVESGAFTEQAGLTRRSINITRDEVPAVLAELESLGYEPDSPCVIVEEVA